MKRRASKGFSLLEVLVGAVLGLVLYLPLSEALVTGATATQYSEDYLQAVTIAKSQIALLRHAAKINKFAMDKLITAHAAAGGFKPFVVDDVYHVSTTVDPQYSSGELSNLQTGLGGPPTAEATLLSVKVHVAWKISGEDRQLELEALVDRCYY